MYILDTNILAHLLQNNRKVIEFLEKVGEDSFAISVISRFEIMRRAKREYVSTKFIERYLDFLDTIDLNKEIVRAAMRFSRISHKLGMIDLLVAGTARANDAVLITNNPNLRSLRPLVVSIICV